MSKETFKEFVKKNPKLVTHVNKKEMSWQKFYEMYDLYGEDHEVWNDYLKTEITETKTTNTPNISDFMNYFKNMNVDSIQESIGNIQRVLGVLGDLNIKGDNSTKTNYEPKPIYKHFDD